MKLQKLLEGIPLSSSPALSGDREITSLAVDSRQVTPGALFVGRQGTKQNGAGFIADALQRGAAAVVSAVDFASASDYPQACFIRVADPERALKIFATRFYGDPSAEMPVIGVTGTNGKTTFTYLLEAIYRAAGMTCGVIGTVNHRCADRIWPSGNTTPGLADNQQLLREMRAAGAACCVMEVSSHALDQGRADLIRFSTAVFTNLTSDHLDYHHTREAYFSAKAKLFTSLPVTSRAVINLDDPYGSRLLSLTKADSLTYGFSEAAAVRPQRLVLGCDRTEFTAVTPLGLWEMHSALIGRFNVYNILAAITAAIAQGVDPEAIRRGVGNLSRVPGRLEPVQGGQDFFVYTDYAHTQDALWNVLTTLRAIARQRIILVFGCGGDRDKTKRPLMGEVAGSLADFSIVTSDNSRGENTGDIIAQICGGFTRDNYRVIEDRREAIAAALGEAQKDDIVLIAGKGHETYQIFQDRTIDFNEREIVQELLDVKNRRCC
ncbi:MAG: UDP-N-acetylmuramoyl-L-alanyl-D-glutamate--2,6-diaminopimelate ligase [Candidatus Omnitrophica bacterium]|nr:UDP-N-acetylmuramoyl-L-alanyl-D-glutamate--2,6-diaminopimelate ligase [Candidatus Omnitrophota bacterium]